MHACAHVDHPEGAPTSPRPQYQVRGAQQALDAQAVSSVRVYAVAAAMKQGRDFVFERLAAFGPRNAPHSSCTYFFCSFCRFWAAAIPNSVRNGVANKFERG